MKIENCNLETAVEVWMEHTLPEGKVWRFTVAGSNWRVMADLYERRERERERADQFHHLYLPTFFSTDLTCSAINLNSLSSRIHS